MTETQLSTVKTTLFIKRNHSHEISFSGRWSPCCAACNGMEFLFERPFYVHGDCFDLGRGVTIIFAAPGEPKHTAQSTGTSYPIPIYGFYSSRVIAETPSRSRENEMLHRPSWSMIPLFPVLYVLEKLIGFFLTVCNLVEFAERHGLNSNYLIAVVYVLCAILWCRLIWVCF